MANSREILNRMNSIKDTMKITNAMYMISSAKVKKARRSLEKTEPFFDTLHVSLSDMLRCIDDEKATGKWFDKREYLTPEQRNEGFLVITADKGLASAYNYNIVKTVEEKLKANKNNRLYVIGEVGRNYFLKKNITINKWFNFTAQNPSVNRSRAIAEIMMEEFYQGKIDDVYVVYTKMNAHGVSSVETEKILPLEKPQTEDEGKIKQHIEFYPDEKSVLEKLIPSYLSGFVYGALVESFCTENNARMMAMSNATEAAKKMIKELGIQYNHARQSAITQEITEIVAGANALKGEQDD